MEENKNKISLIIDGRKVEVEEGSTILDAARRIGIDIPTLCHLKEINQIGACRICIVEVEGARGYVTACTHPVSEGMIVRTYSHGLMEAKKTTMELILSNHNRECLTCSRNENCELQAISKKLGINEISYEGEKTASTIDEVSPSIVRDVSKCILCKRCVNVCKKVQGVSAIETLNRGFNSKIGCALDKSISESTCINCGQCILNCPVAALKEKSDIKKVQEALANKDIKVVVQTAPAVRVAIGEEFNMPFGTNAEKKMVSGLKQLGFYKVFDTNFAADLTIMEEGTEFIQRLKNKGKLPLITSCSPGWVKYAEEFYPDLLEHLSTAKSPQGMFGAIIKTYFADMEKIDPRKIFIVSIMPCTAKKYESQRPEMQNKDGIRDIDAVLTTRELARLMKQANIDLNNIEDSEYDNPLGEHSGAGVIFGTTGGVMEAALRTVKELLEGKDLDRVEFEAVRGEKGIKEATLNINGMDVNVAVTSGLKNAKKIMDEIREGKSKYHFVEIMACPGGCVNGGGQPIHSSLTKVKFDIPELRRKTIYKIDEELPIRKSHENPMIKEIYKTYLKEPGSHLAHELLHTRYTKRDTI